MLEYKLKQYDNTYLFQNKDGMTISSLKIHDYSRENFDWILVSDVETHPAYRGQGLATNLMGVMHSDVKKRFPGKGIYLFVKVDNKPAINLYRKLGYTTIKEYKLKKGKYFIMCKGSADTHQFDNLKFSG